jgi:DNA-binding winged helix-turn-helix (wHTH) protein
MKWNAEPALHRDNPLPHVANKSSRTMIDATLEFGRFRVLLRRRELLADGVPLELGTRAFDLLLVLAEADGALVTKGDLVTRVWPGVVVSEENLKVQISALRKALGEDSEFIRTEFGRGYRFTATVRRTVSPSTSGRPSRRRRPSRGSDSRWMSRQVPLCRRSVQNQSVGRFDPAESRAVAQMAQS